MDAHFSRFSLILDVRKLIMHVESLIMSHVMKITSNTFKGGDDSL